MAQKSYMMVLWDSENDCWFIPTVDGGQQQEAKLSAMAMRAYLRGAEAEGYDRDNSILIYDSEKWAPDTAVVLAWCNLCNGVFDVPNGRCTEAGCVGVEYRMTASGIRYAEDQERRAADIAKRAKSSMTVLCVVMQCAAGECTRIEAIEALMVLVDDCTHDIAEQILGNTGLAEIDTSDTKNNTLVSNRLGNGPLG